VRALGSYLSPLPGVVLLHDADLARSALRVTSTDELNIAAAAISGATKPANARD
jgi:hypothetical protein